MIKFGRILVGLSVVWMCVLVPPLTSASGGVGLPRSGSGGGQLPPRQVDEIYELGKQIYKGRGSETIKYCVKQDGELKKLRRSTVRPFRGGSPKDLALALFDCGVPDRLALTTVQKDQIPVVLYYLNKRFKLELSDS